MKSQLNTMKFFKNLACLNKKECGQRMWKILEKVLMLAMSKALMWWQLSHYLSLMMNKQEEKPDFLPFLRRKKQNSELQSV